MKTFALIGAAGYIAPRHMKAIKESGNALVAALDHSDNVGVLDSYFPDTHFFTEFERFDRHIDKLRRSGQKVDYVSICSPNYLHDAHIRFALRSQADAICEKPLVLNPWNLEPFSELESEFGKKIHAILQLRLHPAIQNLKAQMESAPADKIHEIDLTYITSRGRWYDVSWKGDISKSGGIATNIGVHFFDMLGWIFGELKENRVYLSQAHKASGVLELERARVRWFLSIDSRDLPGEIQARGQRTFRSITVDGEEVEFSEGFADLHTLSYEKILKGEGFGISDAQASIQIVHDIRNRALSTPSLDSHPLCQGR